MFFRKKPVVKPVEPEGLLLKRRLEANIKFLQKCADEYDKEAHRKKLLEEYQELLDRYYPSISSNKTHITISYDGISKSFTREDLASNKITCDDLGVRGAIIYTNPIYLFVHKETPLLKSNPLKDGEGNYINYGPNVSSSVHRADYSAATVKLDFLALKSRTTINLGKGGSLLLPAEHAEYVINSILEKLDEG